MDEPAEKIGLRNAWDRVAGAYADLWANRTAHISEHGLDLLAPASGSCAIDVACGPGHTTVALADRLGGGSVVGVDFAPAMVDRAAARFGDRPGVAFAVDDAEGLAREPGSVDVLTCHFGLMYCYDARAAMASAARTLRPDGRMLQVVWGRAPAVWWAPVIALIETRAEYFSAVCPMMFFYGLPGVMPRMVGEAGLELIEHETWEARMAFRDVDDAVATAIHGAPLAGLFAHRLGPEAQQEVREAMRAHVQDIAAPGADGGITLPAEAVLVVAARPG
jgi:ubiquinone/menaquinone biosynthesis C-methylase UbiE